MKTPKRYVIRVGQKTGIFTDRKEVQPLVMGYPGAKYKSFTSPEEAKTAWKEWRETYYQTEKKRFEKDIPFIKTSIAVDAACSSASGEMEYQGIDLLAQKKIFHLKIASGTNNIGEFLGIVHGLAYLKEKKSDFALYSDSKIAINRIKEGKCKTNLSPSPKHQQLFTLIQRAEARLKQNTYTTTILKRNTKERGEIPADFGRK